MSCPIEGQVGKVRNLRVPRRVWDSSRGNPLHVQTPLDDLVGWYVEHCNGEWEHSYGVTLDTLDNPGWSLKVDLNETRLEGVAMERTVIERAEDDWIQAWSDGAAFYAAGGPRNLHEIVGSFADFAARA